MNTTKRGHWMGFGLMAFLCGILAQAAIPLPTGWSDNWVAVKQDAYDNNKPLMVLVGKTSGCPNCENLETRVLNSTVWQNYAAGRSSGYTYTNGIAQMFFNTISFVTYDGVSGKAVLGKIKSTFGNGTAYPWLYIFRVKNPGPGAEKDDLELIASFRGTAGTVNGVSFGVTAESLIAVVESYVTKSPWSSYFMNIAAPTVDYTFSDNGASATVTLSSRDNATIYYTTNGNKPTTSSTRYTKALTITTATTLKAIAYGDGKISDVTTLEIDKQPNPIITVAEDKASFSLTYGSTDEEGFLVYTLDGSEPSFLNGYVYEDVAVEIDETVTVINARALAYGDLSSAVVTKEVERQPETGTVEPPEFTINATNPVWMNKLTVSLSCPTDDATILYAIGDGETFADYQTYKGAFSVVPNKTVKAKAIKENWDDSEEVSKQFTMLKNTVVLTGARIVDAGETTVTVSFDVTPENAGISIDGLAGGRRIWCAANETVELPVGATYTIYAHAPDYLTSDKLVFTPQAANASRTYSATRGQYDDGDAGNVQGSFGPGWNLVALPAYDFTRRSMEVLAERLYQFDAAKNALVKAETIEAGGVYYWYAEADDEITVTGRAGQAQGKSLPAGWNLAAPQDEVGDGNCWVLRNGRFLPVPKNDVSAGEGFWIYKAE